MKDIGTSIIRHNSKRVLFPSISICTSRSSDPKFRDNGSQKSGLSLIDLPIKPNISKMLYELDYYETNDTGFTERIKIYPSKEDINSNKTFSKVVRSHFVNEVNGVKIGSLSASSNHRNDILIT